MMPSSQFNPPVRPPVGTGGRTYPWWETHVWTGLAFLLLVIGGAVLASGIGMALILDPPAGRGLYEDMAWKRDAREAASVIVWGIVMTSLGVIRVSLAPLLMR
jgi:hypothetical protein